MIKHVNSTPLCLLTAGWLAFAAVDIASAADKAEAALVKAAPAYPEAWEDDPWGERAIKVRKKIFQWDSYLIGGVGLMRTQPIPIFDPELRSFDWNTNVAFNVGAGLRIFLTRYLTFFTEFRAYMWPDQFENIRVAPNPADRRDPSTWLQSGSTFVANTSIQIGFTLFLPIKFEYRLPK